MSGRKRIAALVVAVLTLLVGLTAAAASSSARPYNHNAQASCSTAKPTVGGTFTMNGQDFLPNDHVVITLHSRVTTLGSVDADANGNFHKVLQLPAGVKGAHTVVATGTGGPPKDQATCHFVIGGRDTGGGNNHGGGNSNTGVQVLGIGLLGVALLVGGMLFVLSARRRRTAESA